MINDMIQSDYFDKGTDFSASDFTKPLYQLWVSKNFEKNEDDKQSLPAWVGQLVHKASYDTPEVDVIKELSVSRNVGEYSIGGSIDRIERHDDRWFIADIKTQGNFPAKKAFKDGGKEEWITQLSVYRWLLDDYCIIAEDIGIIHQYVMGFTKNKDGMEDYNEIEILLTPLDRTEEMIQNKIEIAKGDEPLMVDCPTAWMCDSYCSYRDNCPSYQKE